MTREQALDVLRSAFAKRQRIKRIEENILSGRRGLSTLDEMREQVLKIKYDLVQTKEQRREAMRVLSDV